MNAIFPMDYIHDKILFKAVMFARNMIGDGEPAAKANSIAAHYYHKPVSEVAHYVGQCGGRIKAIRNRNMRNRNPFSAMGAVIKKWKLEYSGKTIEGSGGMVHFSPTRTEQRDQQEPPKPTPENREGEAKMFYCNMCKQNVEGAPARKGGRPSRELKFCARCAAVMVMKQTEGLRNRSKALNGSCIFCGRKMSENPSSSGNGYEHVCKICNRTQKESLRLIRYSDRFAKYIASREEREGPAREARIKAEQEAAKARAPEAPIKPETETIRIERIETLLGRIVEKLGL